MIDLCKQKIHATIEQPTKVDQLRLLETELDFLYEMRITDAEAIANELYEKRGWYDQNLQIKNHGFMTLVAPAYFEFGHKLIRCLSGAITQEKIGLCGSASASNTKNVLEKTTKLRDEFLECASSFPFLNEEAKNRIYRQLVEKVANTKIKDETDEYKERMTGRWSAGCCDAAHREPLKYQAKG
jgi:hypothetical protein